VVRQEKTKNNLVRSGRRLARKRTRSITLLTRKGYRQEKVEKIKDRRLKMSSDLRMQPRGKKAGDLLNREERARITLGKSSRNVSKAI